MQQATKCASEPAPTLAINNALIHDNALVESQNVGSGTRIWAFAHILKGALIGRNCNIGDHCFVEGGAEIGNDVVVKNGVAIWSGVTLQDRVFVGPNVAFTNDHIPRAKVFREEYDRTLICEGATLGANATVVAPATVGRFAVVGAGAVVTRDVGDFEIVIGSPARLNGFACECGRRLPFRTSNGRHQVEATCVCGISYQHKGGRVRRAANADKTQVRSGAAAVRVPFVNLRAQYDELRPEIDEVIAKVIDGSAFIGGEAVREFERSFAEYCGTKHAVACASGTDAMQLALMAAGVQSGDEVVTVPNTFIATVEAITRCGAHPVFVDIDSSTYNMSPEALARFLESNCRQAENVLVDRKTGRPVRAVLPVHLYGLPSDMAAILNIAAKYGLLVVEDACQAHGAEIRMNDASRRVGNIGDIAGFSFYPGKNLGAMGEGGAVVTNDDSMARNVGIWHDHGQSERYIHVSPHGWNGRLDALQCAILNVKIKKLDEWNSRRRAAAEWYRERLCNMDRVGLPTVPEGKNHVFHLFVIQIPDRDSVQREMTSRGIGVGLHYPIPLHLQEAYRGLGLKRGDFPKAEAAAASILSLPMFPHITESQVDEVCQALRDILC